MNRMMPIILTRRKRPFQRNEADETQNKSSTASGARSVSASAQDGIRVVDHPTRPEALVVVVPETAGLQSVLDALTAKRKERGTPGPNKFIFLSGRCGSDDEVKALFQATSENKNILRPEAGVAGNDQTLPNSGLPVTNELNCSVLDDSLTNIQWLGKINTQVSGPEAGKKDSDKEKFDGCIQLQEPQYTEEEPSAIKGPLSERPPYSYMAMIQFAINSKKNKMMTLKEIYNWIEDHFPYFRNVAKPGWKNSIRHNLSLHDMFIRENPSDSKISYWTIKNEANRCLTLDQVYKPAVDPAASSFPQAMQVCYQQQQKRVMADPKKATVCTTGIQSAMNRMMTSPRRPIILTRRKRPFQRNEADETQNKSSTASGARSVSASAQDGIRIVDHPTRPDTQVVVIPKTDQSVLDLRTAKVKERGTQGPNKFILLSGSSGSEDGVKALFQATSENKNLLRPEAGVAGNDQTLPNSGLAVKNEPNCSVLDDSLTNIQWLGKMSTQVSGPEAGKKDSDKEIFDGCVQLQEPQHTEEDPSAVKGPLSGRPPYSYMAMIQFAINSKKNKMMTLKEIYNWIEDHFPYFRNIAKPGWKNSIRHNLSLNDMFIRESTPDGKISYWTIKPEANRGLTLDQVYKPAVDPAASSFPQAMQVCYQQVPKSESSVVVMSAPVAEVEEERVCVPVSEPCNSEQKEILRKRYERISRRKQRLVPLFNEEPVLLFDSSLVSTFQEMECDLEPRQDLQLQGETFKTPDKGSHPFSSTPSNSPEPWKITPLDKGNRGVMDFSPIRTPPQRHEHSELSFCSKLFRDLPLFGSPRELLASCSHEQQTESSNHSLTEGFVLDTMNDSLSKILMDISFTGLEDDDLDMANLSWSQFIPELKLDVSL